jgi:hypothetical protein
MRSPAVHPLPRARMREAIPPGAPLCARRTSASFSSTAIFARNRAPRLLYNQLMTTVQNEFVPALAAEARSAAIPETADVYGWLIGSWDLDVLRFGVDVSGQGIKGEVHFAWVLEGRVVQDVWIMPGRADRNVDLTGKGNMYGTTLRVWNEQLQAWRIIWINGATGAKEEMTGRRIGKDIVQVGSRADGTPIRWMFTEITPDSFRWTGEVLESDGATWKLEGEFRARRRR